jgi:hypothetical protein
MRIVSVLGVLTLGMGMGSAAVMLPLVLKSAPTETAASQGSIDSQGPTGASGWSAVLNPLARYLDGPATQPAGTAAVKPAAQTTAQSTAQTTALSAAPAGQSARTFDYLSNLAAPAPAKHADARVVETPWTTQVAAERTAPRKLTSSKPNSEEQRRSLVLDLQNELKRVGCFDGEPDGHWGATSKRAMAAFTDRVNASLPFEQPDFILLTLVQGHAGRACGKTCPSGQGLADNGRCIPNSILARADKPADKPLDKPAAVADATVQSQAGQPQLTQPRVAAVTSGWTTNTVRSAVETGSMPYRQTVPQPTRAPEAVAIAMPTPVPPAPVPAVRPRSEPARTTVAVADTVSRSAPLAEAQSAPLPEVRSAPPLPGRMAIGGPLAAPDASPAEPVTAAESPETPAKVHKHKPAAQSEEPAHAAARPKRAPEPVVVHRPPPPPAKPYYAPRTASATDGMSKSRRLVYEMFQRPDRN